MLQWRDDKLLHRMTGLLLVTNESVPSRVAHIPSYDRPFQALPTMRSPPLLHRNRRQGSRKPSSRRSHPRSATQSNRIHEDHNTSHHFGSAAADPCSLLCWLEDALFTRHGHDGKRSRGVVEVGWDLSDLGYELEVPSLDLHLRLACSLSLLDWPLLPWRASCCPSSLRIILSPEWDGLFAQAPSQDAFVLVPCDGNVTPVPIK